MSNSTTQETKQCAFSPSALIADYTELNKRSKEAIAVLDEMRELLRSALCIAERQGEQTNWEGFAASIRKLGLTGITARTYRQLETDHQTPECPLSSDGNPSA